MKRAARKCVVHRAEETRKEEIRLPFKPPACPADTVGWTMESLTLQACHIGPVLESLRQQIEARQHRSASRLW